MSGKKDKKGNKSSLSEVPDNEPIPVARKKKPPRDIPNDLRNAYIDNQEEIDLLDDLYQDQASIIDKHEELWNKSFDPNFKPNQEDLDNLKEDLTALRSKINDNLKNGTLDANKQSGESMLKRLDAWEARLDNLVLTKTNNLEEPKTANSKETARQPSSELTVLPSTTMPTTIPDLPKELFPATTSEASDKKEQENQENIDNSSSKDTPHN